MRILAVCFGLVLVASCAQVQTRTHYDRWAAAEREAAEPAPGPQPASARRARPPKAAAPARAPSARSAGDTPEMRPGEAPRRGRALRPEDDEEDEEVIY